MPGPNRNRERAFADELFRRLLITSSEWEESERPDCSFVFNGIRIGMEITESTPSEIYWGADIIQKASEANPFKPIVYGTSNLRDHGRQRTKNELIDDMLNNPEYVNMADSRRWWCEDVKKSWAKKRKKLNESNYTRYDENWLLIWDNEGLSEDRITFSEMDDEINRAGFPQNTEKEFDHIYVISGSYLFCFVPNGYNYSMELEEGRWLHPKRNSTLEEYYPATKSKQ